MATIGQVLAEPEVGWKRIKNSDSLISYVGPNWQIMNGGYFTYVATNIIRFNFTGSKIRVIGGYDPNWAATKVKITIDGTSYIYDQSVGGAAPIKLLFDKIDLQNDNHNIEITGTDSVDSSHWFGLWAIDVEDTVVIAKPTNLTATAGDSQVVLSWQAVDGAIGYKVKRSTVAGGPYPTIDINVIGTTYVDKTVTNGTTYYYVVTAIDGNGNESVSSNEASATPKAGTITPPTGNALLRVTMIDSSEREYRLTSTEITGFINWYTRTIGTGISCYAVKDIVDNSTEYLAFEKIISFKVMELAK